MPLEKLGVTWAGQGLACVLHPGAPPARHPNWAPAEAGKILGKWETWSLLPNPSCGHSFSPRMAPEHGANPHVLLLLD